LNSSLTVCPPAQMANCPGEILPTTCRWILHWQWSPCQKSKTRQRITSVSTNYEYYPWPARCFFVQCPRRSQNMEGLDAHRLYLLYVTSTRWQPANLYYNQQGNRRPPGLRDSVLAWLWITSSDGPLKHSAGQGFLSTGSKMGQKEIRRTNRYFGLGISYFRPPNEQEDFIASNSVIFNLYASLFCNSIWNFVIIF